MRRIHLVYAALAALIVVSAWLVALLTPTDELARFRNSLVSKVGTPGDFEWGPNPPAGYRLETAAAPAEMLLAIPGDRSGGTIGLVSKIVDGLHTKPKLSGGIKSTTISAYHEIITTGRGYCADYTQVLNGLSHAAGLTAREWGMSFDSFSGNGHAFSEVYDEQTGRWIFLDPMNGFYVRDRESGTPLSVLEFRSRLIAPDGFQTISIVPIGHSFLFPSAREAFDYYAAGADQFFMWFGNDVFTYDNNWAVRLLGWSRPIEQLAAILLGVHPEIRILETESNRDEIEALFRLRFQVIALTVVACVLLAYIAVHIGLFYRSKRKRP